MNAIENRRWLLAHALVLEMGAAETITLTRADIPQLREMADQLMPAAYGFEGAAAVRREACDATH